MNWFKKILHRRHLRRKLKKREVEREFMKMASLFESSNSSLEAFFIKLDLTRDQYKHITCKKWLNPFTMYVLEKKFKFFFSWGICITTFFLGALGMYISASLLPLKISVVLLQFFLLTSQMVIDIKSLNARHALNMLEIENFWKKTKI